MLATVKHQRDDMGQVLIGPDIVCRHIFPQSRDWAIELLNSELFKELTEKKFFPCTRVRAESARNDELVLEHARAAFILYPWEWSFSMLKNAALTLIEIAEMCHSKGYYLQDSHSLNMMFFGCRPMFVDFGSFRKGRRQSALQIQQFIEYFYLPLALWADGNFYIANQILSDDYRGMRLQPFGALVGSPIMRKYLQKFIKRKDLSWSCKRAINLIVASWPSLRNGLYDLSNYGAIDQCDYATLRNAIKELKPPGISTEWANYHDRLPVNNGTRYEYLINLIGKYHWMTVMDVAGNGGYFAEQIAFRFHNAKILCMDYDSEAVEKCYYRCCSNRELRDKVTPAMINIMYPNEKFIGIARRAAADLVIALAVTHHLLLSQGADCRVILTEMLNLSNRYLLVEFMPLGLWDGKVAPKVPQWYTLEWFRAELASLCAILEEQQVEENRIVFMCEKGPQHSPAHVPAV